ncbi:MAG TPA: hypothetical protein PLL36_02345 [Candidatus Hydrogenedentes bacterium]|nr:hypothetical protein [Candidatus Hydrogenedentota bacterium]
MERLTWSKADKKCARVAFDAAYERECASILAELRKRVDAIRDSDDIWGINDYLWRKRREIGDKYDFRGSVLADVLVRLMREGWITLDELQGLSEEKRDLLSRGLGFFKNVSGSPD